MACQQIWSTNCCFMVGYPCKSMAKAKHTRLDHELHYSAIIVLFLQGATLQWKRIWKEEIINMMVDITKKKHSMDGRRCY